ncbi:MAG TPA: hypothetical protein ENJ18_04115 [Nannocystis exedens]|nr:hypothetical protein [Nannocystis exedens]
MIKILPPDPAIQHSNNNPANQQSGNPATRQPGNPATRQPNAPTLRYSGNPATRQTINPALRQPGTPTLRHSGKPENQKNGPETSGPQPKKAPTDRPFPAIAPSLAEQSGDRLATDDDRSTAMNQAFSLQALLRYIEPTRAQGDAARASVQQLRAQLQDADDLGPHILSLQLHGSLQRHTALRPTPGAALEVDLLVITDRRRQQTTPEQAFRLFLPFLRRHYSGHWALRGRLLTISRPCLKIKLKLVVAAAHDWGDPNQPIYIPNREASRWEPTHPQALLAWTEAKDARCKGHYVEVVRAIKAWRRSHRGLPAQCRSYPLEHLVGHCCPDGINSAGDGIARTFSAMATIFEPAVSTGRRPSLPCHGLPQKDVLARCNAQEFAALIRAGSQAASQAERALHTGLPSQAADLWRELLGLHLLNLP